jgi:aldehyde dehydrogenase
VLIEHERQPSDNLKPVINPAQVDEVVGHVALGTAEDADAAVVAADGAFPSWSALSADERAKLLLKAAETIEVCIEDRARLLTREHGKVLWESKTDAIGAVKILRYYAGLAEEYAQDKVIEDARGRIVLTRRPIGVGVVIVPWNYPVLLAFLMLAPALLAGNTVVVKPSELTPLALCDTLRILAEELPPGVVNVVPGYGHQVGAALVRHPRVRKISFTGSVDTGRTIMREAASTVKNVGLEMGGNDPALILESATISDRLISELIKSVFISSGQICYNVKRLYVQRAHYDDFVEQFTQAADEIVVGNGLDSRSTIGPLNNERQFRFVSDLVERTRRSSAVVRTVGRKLDPTTWDRGYFLLPTVVTGIHPESELVACEQFGPVIPILPFNTEEEAVRLANATEFGLAASVWTDDVDHGFDVARQLEAGTAFVNVHRVGASDVSMPFGGFKQSGIGRGHGFIALEENSELQTLAHRIDM